MVAAFPMLGIALALAYFGLVKASLEPQDAIDARLKSEGVAVVGGKAITNYEVFLMREVERIRTERLPPEEEVVFLLIGNELRRLGLQPLDPAAIDRGRGELRSATGDAGRLQLIEKRLRHHPGMFDELVVIPWMTSGAGKAGVPIRVAAPWFEGVRREFPSNTVSSGVTR